MPKDGEKKKDKNKKIIESTMKNISKENKKIKEKNDERNKKKEDLKY